MHRLATGRAAGTGTHVEVVQARAVDVDEDLSGLGLGLGRVLGDRDVGGVGVVRHDESAHVAQTMS